MDLPRLRPHPDRIGDPVSPALISARLVAITGHAATIAVTSTATRTVAKAFGPYTYADPTNGWLQTGQADNRAAATRDGYRQRLRPTRHPLIRHRRTRPRLQSLGRVKKAAYTQRPHWKQKHLPVSWRIPHATQYVLAQ
ncbi:hypothetical protein AB0I28_35465 [Phytomonospora sp. NPDC050363]|uniref:hypothetical protein n=1 Tax=Phytomonospora sp. NPDC050363 TaxID=3155642 RepID=UPI00340D1DDE